MQAEISPELLEELRRRAREQGRPERELFEGIGQGQRERGVVPLSEDEAMRLAVEEQRAWRRERRSTG